jgi:microcystin-dependent protein
LISGSPYSLKYSVANSAWMLREFFGSPFGIALGGLLPYTGTTAPNSNFILPAGQCISTTTYAGYWALLGSPAPGGCGAGTFAVIDMRGRLPIASDNLNGSFAGRLTSSANGCGITFNTIGNQCGTQGQTLTLAQLPGGLQVANGSQAISVTGPTSGNALWIDGASGNIPTSGSLTVPLQSSGFATGNNFSFSASNNLTMTSNNTSGSAHANVQPTIAVSYLLRVI